MRPAATTMNAQRMRTVPLLRPGIVQRDAIVERLRHARDVSIVSVVAPAGYGKTTVLAQWAEVEQRAVAWLTLEDADDDPVVLVRDIASALEDAGVAETPGLVGRHRAGTSIWSRLVPALQRQMAEAEPFLLVLDDVHEVSSRDALDVVAALADALPDGSTLALGGRTEITSLVPRARSRRAVLELGSSELELTRPEAASLIEAAGLTVDEDEVAALHDRTEGWAAGLALMVMARDLGGEWNDPDTVDRFVEDFFLTEELSHLDPDVLAFMTRSSVLARLSGPLCDAMLERDDSQSQLEAIERFNHFLVPLDHHRSWYRYHELFRGALLRQLERNDPEAVEPLRERAADWCGAHGLPEQAMRYALASEDIDRAARLLVAHAVPLYRQGRAATVESWLSRFETPELLARYPDVAALGALFYALCGRAFQAERWLDAGRWSTSEGRLLGGSAETGGLIALLDALLCRHGPYRMAEDAELALESLGPLSPFRAPALLLRGTALWLQGDRLGATAHLERAAEGAVESGAILAGTNALAQLALHALDENDVPGARRLLERTSALDDSGELDDYMASGPLLAACARLEAAEGNAERASELLARVERLRPQLTYTIPFISLQTLLASAQAYLSLGRAVAARSTLEQGRRIVEERPDLGVLVEELTELTRQARGTPKQDDVGWQSSLTAAELRLLPLLTTHLTFREIGERLFVSRNTVKTQAISIYRKLDATSRGEAVSRAAELGLVDTPSVGAERITPTG